jgi:hypothetical protein
MSCATLTPAGLPGPRRPQTPPLRDCKPIKALGLEEDCFHGGSFGCFAGLELPLPFALGVKGLGGVFSIRPRTASRSYFCPTNPSAD